MSDIVNLKKSFDIHINSDDRISGTNSNFIVNLNGTQSLGFSSGYLQVKDLQFVSSAYQVKTNDVFAFSVDGTSTISFDFSGFEGTYTVTSLLALLKSRMETLDGNANTYTFTYNADRNKISFTATFSTGVAQIRCSLCSDNIQKIIGCQTVSLITQTISNGTPIEFPQQVDLYPEYNYYLTCNWANTNNNISSNNNFPRNAILKISPTVRFSRLYYRYSDVVTNNLYRINNITSTINISIVDENNRTLEFDSNFNIQLQLRIFPD